MAKFTWNEETTAQLTALAGDGSETISQARLTEISEELGTTNRSAGSKLRKLGFSVQKVSELNSSAWSEADEAELVQFVQDNAGSYTYGEIAEIFQNGAYGPKQVQGKILSLEMTDKVKRTEKKAAPKKYTEEQEAKFVELMKQEAFLEDIATQMGVTINSARGKALSLTQAHEGLKMPVQKESRATKTNADALEGLNVEALTIEELATKTGHTPRGLKSMLSRRGISCADYDGAAKRAKLDAAKAAE